MLTILHFIFRETKAIWVGACGLLTQGISVSVPYLGYVKALSVLHCCVVCTLSARVEQLYQTAASEETVVMGTLL